MSETKTLEGTEKVGELDVDTLVALLRTILAERRGKGDQRLIDMTVKEFYETIQELQKQRGYQAANAEASVAQQILTDWNGLQGVDAVTQPFRVRTMAEVEQFAQNLKGSFAGLHETKFPTLVIAVAILNENGTYSTTRRIGG